MGDHIFVYFLPLLSSLFSTRCVALLYMINLFTKFSQWPGDLLTELPRYMNTNYNPSSTIYNKQHIKSTIFIIMIRSVNLLNICLLHLVKLLILVNVCLQGIHFTFGNDVRWTYSGHRVISQQNENFNDRRLYLY